MVYVPTARPYRRQDPMARVSSLAIQASAQSLREPVDPLFLDSELRRIEAAIRGIQADITGVNDSIPTTTTADILYVKDAPYNAACDGTTDDTTAIQTAINDGVAQGKVVHLGYGTSVVDRLTLDTGLRLVGYGKGKSILKRKASSSLDSVLKATSKNSFELRGFSIDGNKANQSTNSNNIWLDSCYKFQIVDVASEGCKGQHIASNSHIGHGLYLIDCTDYSQGTRSYVVRCKLDGNDHHGLEGHRSGNITIAHNTANTNERQGIAFFNFTDPHVTSGNIAGVQIIGNEARDNVVGNGISLPGYWESGAYSAPVYGIATNDSFDCIVANNVCTGNGRYGIAFQAVHSAMIGNVCSHNGYAGALFNAGYSICSGNVIEDNPDWGMDAGGAIRCSISGNMMRGGAVVLNLGAAYDTVVSSNLIDSGGDVTTCISLPGIDGDGNTPFPWVGKNVQIVDNSIFGDGSAIGIWVHRNFRHALIANNRLTGFDDNDGIIIETVNGQCYGNFTRPGTGDTVTQTYASATTLVLPDHVNFAVISGSTNITDIKLFSKNVFDGKVMDVNMTNQGSGYTSAPSVSFSGGGGSGAAATAELANNGKIIGVNMTSHGSGYTSAPSVSFSGGGGSAAAGNALVSARNNEDRLLVLKFTGSCTVSGPSNNLNLKSDFQSKNGSVLVLYGSSGAWYEVARANEDFTGTATSSDGSGTSGSVTLNRMVGVVTTNSATSAENSNFSFTVNNSCVENGDIVLWEFANGSNSGGVSGKGRTVVNSGSFQCFIRNLYTGGLGTAFNGTFVIRFQVIKAA